MSSQSNIFIDPGSTDAIPVYLVVASGVNTYLPRAALNDSSGNEITYGNPLNIVGTVATVLQGTSPWLVNASVIGSPTVSQGGAPWLVNASIVGQQAVTATTSAPLPVVATYAAPWQIIASQSGIWNVNATIASTATVAQGTNPWTVLGTVTIGAGAGVVAVTNVTLAALATVYQGTIPWLVNASVVGQAAVTASLIGTPGVTATYSGPWNVVVSQGNGTWTINASVVGTPIIQISTIVTLAVGSMPAITVGQTLATIGGGFIVPQADAGAVGSSISYISALTNTIVTIKGTGTANLYGYHIYNPNAAVSYISLFAATNATIGKTTPTAQLVAPAGGWIDSGYDVPISFTSGLMLGASASTNGTGAPTTGLIANFWYK